MIEFHGLLKNLQSEVVALLASDSSLLGPPTVDVLTEDEGDIERKIEKSIGPLGSGGGVVIVSIPEPTPQDARRPFMFGITLTIQCIENAIVNRSSTGNNIQSNRLGEIVHLLLNNYSSTAGWTRFQRVTWDTGFVENGNFGDRIVFACETVYDIDVSGNQNFVYWGKHASTTLTESQVLGLSNNEIVTTIPGSRAFSAGAGYAYFCCLNTLDPLTMKIGDYAMAMADTIDGYTLTSHGIHYKTLSVDSQTYRIYRSAFILNGPITLTVT